MPRGFSQPGGEGTALLGDPKDAASPHFSPGFVARRLGRAGILPATARKFCEAAGWKPALQAHLTVRRGDRPSATQWFYFVIRARYSIKILLGVPPTIRSS